MLSGDKIQVMAGRARLLKELFGRRTVICSATGLGLRGGLACAEVLYKVINEDRHILRIDLRTVGNHRSDEPFPAFFVQFESDNTIEAMACGASVCQDLLSVTIWELRVLNSRKGHRCQ